MRRRFRIRVWLAALAAVAAGTVGGVAWVLISDSEPSIPEQVLRISSVSGQASKTALLVSVDDSCGGTAHPQVISQGGSLVIIAAPTEPGSFPMCADGGPSTGIADLEADLGSRTIVVLQPRDGSADVECTIDDALSSACTSRRLK